MRVNVRIILFLVSIILMLELFQLATGCCRSVCYQEHVVWSTSLSNIPEPEALPLLVIGLACLAYWYKLRG